ncbi:UNVERIFIED_ORG: hypothetical protein GGE63_006427 [Rhizobium esperanzae]|nr:hypothetical protein RPHASCH2410_PD04675 [Rhizobium phaseoli Ch24-10]
MDDNSRYAYRRWADVASFAIAVDHEPSILFGESLQ